MNDDPVAHAGAKMMQGAAAVTSVAEAVSHVAAARARGRASRMVADERMRQSLTSRSETVQGTLPDAESVRQPIDDVRRARLLAVHEDAEEFYRKGLDASWVPEYLSERGLDSSAWAVGYAPAEWTTTTDHLRKQGHTEQDLLDAGLSVRSSRGTLVDRFRDRLMVSVRNSDGETVGFTGRLNPASSNRREPKWKNSPETELYRKGSELPGVFEGRDRLAAGATPVVVESPFDAMAVTAATNGKCVGVAACGTAFTAAQFEMLKSACDLNRVSVTFAFDGDAAGEQATLRAFDVVNGADVDTPMAVVLPAGDDPASMVEAGRGADLKRLFTHEICPLDDLVVDAKLAPFAGRTQWVENRVNAMRAVAPTIASLRTADAGHQVWRVAQRLDLPMGTVTAALAEHVSPSDAHVVPFVQAELRARQQASRVLDRSRSR